LFEPFNIGGRVISEFRDPFVFRRRQIYS